MIRASRSIVNPEKAYHETAVNTFMSSLKRRNTCVDRAGCPLVASGAAGRPIRRSPVPAGHHTNPASRRGYS